MLRTFLNAKVSVSKQRKGAFRARKTLQNPGYSVLKQMRALFFSIVRLRLSKTKITSDNVKSSYTALYSEYYVKILENVEKKLFVGIY